MSMGAVSCGYITYIENWECGRFGGICFYVCISPQSGRLCRRETKMVYIQNFATLIKFGCLEV